eukprot:TRINITY_DN14681_c0_g1_i3.p1 TRINITY_DN14681_c0_g1~~TRINITY_DN14681_c0_g1_i3.p1  ORF type:complete len:177 (+),score=33.38 TRINITY_DN14681_c0_g1_i3:179-709(+)
MDDTSGNNQDDLGEMVHTNSGQLCKPIQQPTPMILELLPRPVSNGNGLFHNTLEPGETMYVPTILIDWLSTEEGEVGEMQSNAGNTKVDRNNVVAPLLSMTMDHPINLGKIVLDLNKEPTFLQWDLIAWILSGTTSNDYNYLTKWLRTSWLDIWATRDWRPTADGRDGSPGPRPTA